MSKSDLVEKPVKTWCNGPVEKRHACRWSGGQTVESPLNRIVQKFLSAAASFSLGRQHYLRTAGAICAGHFVSDKRLSIGKLTSTRPGLAPPMAAKGGGRG